MGDKTGIEWTDATWNPIRGCSRVSEGCRNCYAEKVAARFSGKGLPYHGLVTDKGQWNGKIRLVEDHLDDPLRWKKPRRIFVNSMSDLFHPNIKQDWILKILHVMGQAQQHTFQVLTKRPETMQAFFDVWKISGRYGEWPFKNVWLGVSVENQKTADERIPWLLKTPAMVRFISYEPALGPVQFTRVCGLSFNRLPGHDLAPNNAAIDWVICGGESGPDARPMHPDWARSVRDQCAAAGVPFFFKQWGEYAQVQNDRRYEELSPAHGCMIRVGKKRAGRLLDGREHNDMPERILNS